MKNKIYLLVAIILAGFSFGCQPESDELNPEITDALSKRAPSQFQTDKYIVITHDETLPAGLAKKIEDAGGIISKSLPELGLLAVTATDKKFASKVKKMSEVRNLVPDLKLQWIEPGKQVEAVADVANPPFSGDDDFFFDLQWGADAIDAPEAWAAGYTGAGVRVAVLDGGFDLDHPDLAPNIDLSTSASYVVNEDGTSEGLEYAPNDPFSHGTHVAGTIAAADNSFGVIGIAPEATLVLIKVLEDVSGSGLFSWIISGIYHAALVDVDVINMSLGATVPQGIGVGSNEIAALKIAVNRAIDFATKSGALVITSAGNEAINGNKDGSLLVIPASSPKALSISATAPIGWAADPENAFLDYLASYSNYGSSLIDFGAPGGDAVYPGNEGAVIAGLVRPVLVFDLVFSTGSLGSWYWSAGTSMAAPHAAGVAALIIGKNGGDMDPAKVISILKKSADDLGKPGKDDYYGYGRVNAYKAIME